MINVFQRDFFLWEHKHRTFHQHIKTRIRICPWACHYS